MTTWRSPQRSHFSRSRLSRAVVIAQIRTQLGQVEARAVPTGAARRSIVVRFVNVFEPSGFEAGVFHPLTLPPPGSGLLGYNSYSN